PNIILLDPASTALSNGTVWGTEWGAERGAQSAQRPTQSAARGEPNGAGASRSALGASLVSPRRSLFFRRAFDWHEDAPPLTALEDSIIYELHVRGFTCHPSAGVAKPGTFAGLVEKIPYLKKLGI